jgi:hypothetical protein
MQNNVEEEDDDEEARGAIMDVCRRIARNDATLTTQGCNMTVWPQETNTRLQWNVSDITLLGQSLVDNTHLEWLTVDMSFESQRLIHAEKALSKGLAQSRVETLGLVRPSLRLQKLLLDGSHHNNQTEEDAGLPLSLKSLDLFCARINTRLLAKRLLLHSPLSSDQLHKCYQLASLTLANCSLDNMDMLTLSLALADNRWLLSLQLDNNGIGDIGLLYFCQHWKNDSPLEEVNLGQNKIGTRGALHLLQVSDQHPSMQTLGLGGNNQVGSQGLEQIAHLLRQSRLCTLKVNNCVPVLPRSSNVSSKEDIAPDLADALVNALRHNTTLDTLDIGGNNLGARGAKRIMQATADHPTLQRLSLGNDETIGFTGLYQIALQLHHTRLTALRLEGIVSSWPMHDKKARQAGQALLKGVLHNETLTFLHCPELPQLWLAPIKFHTNLNATCRPLLSHEAITAAVWPRILAYLHRHGKLGQMYFCLREQPWLIHPRM